MFKTCKNCGFINTTIMSDPSGMISYSCPFKKWDSWESDPDIIPCINWQSKEEVGCQCSKDKKHDLKFVERDGYKFYECQKCYNVVKII